MNNIQVETLGFTCFHVKRKNVKCKAMAISKHNNKAVFLLISYYSKIDQDLRIFSVMNSVSSLK